MPKQFEVTLTFNFDENTEPEDEPKVMALVSADLVWHAAKTINIAHIAEHKVEEVNDENNN